MRSVFRHFIIGVAVVALLAGMASAAVAPTGIGPGQRDRLKSLAAETKAKTERARDELKRARMDLTQIYSSYQLDGRKAKAAQERVSKAQLELLKAHLDNQLQIRRVLNADQFAQFSQMISHRMHGGPMGRSHHGDEPGHYLFPDGKILKSLDLAPNQVKRLRSVMGPERKKAIDKLENNSRQMIDLYERYALDPAAARKLIESIHATQRELAAQNLRSQQAVRSVLTQAQFEKYRDAMVQNVQRHEQGEKHEPQRGFGRR